MYDLIIIGMGISGISAAIYAKRANLNVLLLEGSTPGGALNNITSIENYPGLNSISGPDFAYNLFNKIEELNIAYKLEQVTEVILEPIKTIKTKNNTYQSKYLLISTGRKPKLLGLPKEEEYLGHGISTCALCDGALFKNKTVAVVGGGSSALTEAIHLSKLVNKLYLIHRNDKLRGEETYIRELKKLENVELLLNNEIYSLNTKDNKLIGLTLKDNKEIAIDGLFEYIGFVPNTSFLESTPLKLDNGYIITNDHYETNIKGVYASGDCIKKNIFQLINAASEGACAIINIINEIK